MCLKQSKGMFSYTQNRSVSFLKLREMSNPDFNVLFVDGELIFLKVIIIMF